MQLAWLPCSPLAFCSPLAPANRATASSRIGLRAAQEPARCAFGRRCHGQLEGLPPAFGLRESPRLHLELMQGPRAQWALRNLEEAPDGRQGAPLRQLHQETCGVQHLGDERHLVLRVRAGEGPVQDAAHVLLRRHLQDAVAEERLEDPPPLRGLAVLEHVLHHVVPVDVLDQQPRLGQNVAQRASEPVRREVLDAPLQDAAAELIRGQGSRSLLGLEFVQDESDGGGTADLDGPLEHVIGVRRRGSRTDVAPQLLQELELLGMVSQPQRVLQLAAALVVHRQSQHVASQLPQGHGILRLVEGGLLGCGRGGCPPRRPRRRGRGGRGRRGPHRRCLDLALAAAAMPRPGSRSLLTDRRLRRRRRCMGIPAPWELALMVAAGAHSHGTHTEFLQNRSDLARLGPNEYA
mmetsp:Transcript_76996/g.166576  ORF Transcript_76996/g.166576 Transcript_76996/m.166576 type:complete len:407 (-) Transcript_76996:7-1227(-)